jgi:hypothetical protein
MQYWRYVKKMCALNEKLVSCFGEERMDINCRKRWQVNNYNEENWFTKKQIIGREEMVKLKL